MQVGDKGEKTGVSNEESVATHKHMVRKITSKITWFFKWACVFDDCVIYSSEANCTQSTLLVESCRTLNDLHSLLNSSYMI